MVVEESADLMKGLAGAEAAGLMEDLAEAKAKAPHLMKGLAEAEAARRDVAFLSCFYKRY